MNKKGFIFSIITIVLFSSIFLLSQFYLDRTEELGSLVVQTSISEKMRYLEDDIVSNAYNEMLNLSVTKLERKTNNQELKLKLEGNLTLQNNVDYDNLMELYKNFTETTYANLNNIQINLTNFSANLTIDPYNSILDFNENSFYFYNDPNNIEKIKMTLVVNEFSTINVNENLNNGNVDVELKILDPTGQEIYKKKKKIDPTADNTFTVDFNSGTVQLRFGQFLSYPAATSELTTSLYAELIKLDTTYTLLAEKTIIKGGTILINNTEQDIFKSNEIILIEE